MNLKNLFGENGIYFETLLKPTILRDIFLYFIVSLITAGIFNIWVYKLAEDPNKHFKKHAILEQKMLTGFKSLGRRFSIPSI